MQVSIENTGRLGRTISIAIPQNTIEDKCRDRLQSMSRTIRLQGFRKGKVPYKLVQQRYGKQTKQEVIEEAIRDSLYKTLKQENLRPTTAPEIKHMDDQDGDQLRYTASFEIYPDLELAPMKGLKIERPVFEITDEDIDKMLERLRQQCRRFVDAERPAIMGDLLNIDFEGKLDKQPFQGGSAKAYSLELGRKQLLPGFEEGLVGRSVGEDLVLSIRFPQDHQNASLKGKEAEFSVHINNVQAGTLPDLDQDFFSACHLKANNLEECRQEIRQNMGREADKVVHARLRDALFAALLEANPIEVPNSLVQNEKEAIRQEYKQHMNQQQGGTDTDLPLDPDMDKALNTQANKRVAIRLILEKIMQAQKIKAEPAKIRAKVEAIAANYQDPEQLINWYYADRDRIGQIEMLTLEDEIVERLLQQIQIHEHNYTFDDLMDYRQTQGSDSHDQ